MDNETLKVIRSRTSLRTYAAKPLREEEENAIIESALLAPTAEYVFRHNYELILRSKL